MKIHTLGLGPMGTNCYILESKNDCLIVDPGGDSVKLIEWIKQKELRPQAILLTHAHFDHIGAVDDARDIYHIPVYLHEEEADWLGDPGKNGSKMFPVKQITARDADESLKPGEMKIGQFVFEIRHTPGHSLEVSPWSSMKRKAQSLEMHYSSAVSAGQIYTGEICRL